MENDALQASAARVLENRSSNLEERYNYSIVRKFTVASVFWMLFGLLAGVIIALQLAHPSLNFNEYTTFGRLRPVHTSGVILAFGTNVLFATSLYVVQRTSFARLALGRLMNFVFYAFQIFLVMILSGYMMGITQAKEYAEPEWYANILLVVIWVIYFLSYVLTLRRRKEKHIYVSNWFFLAFITMVAILHVGNNITIPVSFTSTYSVNVFSGVQSAMIQWWYGHNMVGFLLTTAFIGVMYYFIPKRANRPIYSYRLSILHFWALIFLYIWAGPHHLHYTALPDWAQTLGMTMSLILWLPSWGGMVNGIMTVSGAWYKLKEDGVLRFLVVAVAFYGMSTFEGPLLAIKSVNALSHYTDWTISHVHSGALGWVALISFGALYHLVPELWGRRTLYSNSMVNLHLWLSCIGIILYITSMWAAGITEGIMWRTMDEMGFLKYSFFEVVASLHVYYLIRALGGLFFFAGGVLFAYNVVMTIAGKGEAAEAQLNKQGAAV